MTADRVPEWVYLAEVPPPVEDDEPATRCGTCGAPSPEWRTHACPEPSPRAGWVLLALVILAALAVALWRLAR